MVHESWQEVKFYFAQEGGVGIKDFLVTKLRINVQKDEFDNYMQKYLTWRTWSRVSDSMICNPICDPITWSACSKCKYLGLADIIFLSSRVRSQICV